METAEYKTALDIVKGFRNALNPEYRKIFEAYEILDAMLKDVSCFKFITFPESMVYEKITLRTILTLLEQNKFDGIITTASAIDIDLLRTLRICEIENTPNPLNIQRKMLECYFSRITEIFSDLFREYKNDRKKSISLDTFTLLDSLHPYFGNSKVDNSLLSAAHGNEIPIFVPDITGSLLLYSLTQYKNRENLNIEFNIFKDENRLSDLIFDHKKVGGLILGGGISKHHLQWWSSYKNGLDYAVQVTDSLEFDGSLSGARIEESVTWRQLKPSGKGVSLYGDPILLFPLIISAILISEDQE